MSPFLILADMKVGLHDKTSLFFVITGAKHALRISIRKKDDSVESIMLDLINMGLAYAKMKPVRSDDICTLAVAKTKDTAEAFKKAIVEGEQAKVKKLSGYQVIFPIAKKCLRYCHMAEKAPGLYEQLKTSNYISKVD